MVELSEESGKTACFRVKALYSGKQVRSIKEPFQMAKEMVRERTTLQMEENGLVNGATICRTDSVAIS